MKNLTTTQKVLIAIGIIAIIAFVSMNWNKWFPKSDLPAQERYKGLEDCYCNGVYRGKMSKENCQRKCEGSI